MINSVLSSLAARDRRKHSLFVSLPFLSEATWFLISSNVLNTDLSFDLLFENLVIFLVLSDNFPSNENLFPSAVAKEGSMSSSSTNPSEGPLRLSIAAWTSLAFGLGSSRVTVMSVIFFLAWSLVPAMDSLRVPIGKLDFLEVEIVESQYFYECFAKYFL